MSRSRWSSPAAGCAARMSRKPAVPSGRRTTLSGVSAPCASPTTCSRRSAANAAASPAGAASPASVSGVPASGRSTSTRAGPTASSATIAGTGTPAAPARAALDASRSRSPRWLREGRPTTAARNRSIRPARRTSGSPRPSGSTTVTHTGPVASVPVEPDQPRVLLGDLEPVDHHPGAGELGPDDVVGRAGGGDTGRQADGQPGHRPEQHRRDRALQGEVAQRHAAHQPGPHRPPAGRPPAPAPLEVGTDEEGDGGHHRHQGGVGPGTGQHVGHHAPGGVTDALRRSRRARGRARRPPAPARGPRGGAGRRRRRR